MPLKIAVLAKQVLDPEMPMAAFRIDESARRVVPPTNIPPVVNGFDENAVEAALQIKDAQEATVTVISTGSSFALDVMKKPLSMGADDLVLLQDDAFDNTIDSFPDGPVAGRGDSKIGWFRPDHLRSPGIRLGQRPGAARGRRDPRPFLRVAGQEGGCGRRQGHRGAALFQMGTRLLRLPCRHW